MARLLFTPFPSPASSIVPYRFPVVRFPDNFSSKPMAYLLLLLSENCLVEVSNRQAITSSYSVSSYSTFPCRSFSFLLFPPLLFSFSFDVYLPSQVLYLFRLFYHLPLPSLLLGELLSVGCLRSMSITSLRCYYAPIRHPLIFDSFPVCQLQNLPRSRSFLPGMSRTSPVTRYVLIIMLPLPPRRSI